MASHAPDIMSQLWEKQLYNGTEAAADLMGVAVDPPKPASPPPPLPTPAATAKPAAPKPAAAKPATKKKACTGPSVVPNARPTAAGKAPGPSPRSPIGRPGGVFDFSSDDEDDEHPTGAFYPFSDDSDEEDGSPSPSGKSSRKTSSGVGKAPRKKRASRALTEQEKALRRQERNEARQKKERERRERDQQAQYALASEARLASQSRRADALEMLDGLIPLGASKTNSVIGLDARVNKYLRLSDDPERKPHEVLHNRVIALQRAASAPGAIQVMEMRRALGDPNWLPYERARDPKNRTTTKNMTEEELREHRRRLREQAERFRTVGAERREARRLASLKAFQETEAEYDPRLD